MTPPNYQFQKWLEGRWPARSGKKKQGSLSISNTIRKFLLDQSLGAAANTVAFIVLVNLFRGRGLEMAMKEVQRVSLLPA